MSVMQIRWNTKEVLYSKMPVDQTTSDKNSHECAHSPQWFCHTLDYCSPNNSLPWAMYGSRTKTLVTEHSLSWRMTCPVNQSLSQGQNVGFPKRNLQKVGTTQADQRKDCGNWGSSFAFGTAFQLLMTPILYLRTNFLASHDRNAPQALRSLRKHSNISQLAFRTGKHAHMNSVTTIIKQVLLLGLSSLNNERFKLSARIYWSPYVAIFQNYLSMVAF